MKLVKLAFALAAAVTVSACDTPIGPDKSVDRNLIDRKDLSQIKWGVWVDP
ncbi:hypothetical protein HC022_24925, partial [Salipiger sp. HF18]|nr:hypothetical protein [Salipiger sp. HF18]